MHDPCLQAPECDEEAQLAALTTENRTVWAEVREVHFHRYPSCSSDSCPCRPFVVLMAPANVPYAPAFNLDRWCPPTTPQRLPTHCPHCRGVNRASLDIIERAMFCVLMDDHRCRALVADQGGEGADLVRPAFATLTPADPRSRGGADSEVGARISVCSGHANVPLRRQADGACSFFPPSPVLALCSAVAPVGRCMAASQSWLLVRPLPAAPPPACSPQTLSEQAKLLLAGSGGDRWCDKSFSTVIFANGRNGMHVEHSWVCLPLSCPWPCLCPCLCLRIAVWCMVHLPSLRDPWRAWACVICMHVHQLQPWVLPHQSLLPTHPFCRAMPLWPAT